MKAKQLMKDILSLRSALPGRQRWEVNGLRRKPYLAEQVETALRIKPGVIDVKANPLTGRVLVVFEERILNTGVDNLLLEVIGEIADTQLKEDITPQEDNAADLPMFDILKDKDGYKVIRDLLHSVESQPNRRGKVVGRTLLNNIIATAVPFSMGLLAVAILSGGFPFLAKLGLKKPLHQVVLFAGIFFIVQLGESVSEHKCKKEWQFYATEIEHNLRVKTFAHIESLDMAYLENQSTGQLMSLVHDDSTKIRYFLETVPHSFIDKSASFVVVGAFLMWISPISFVLSLVTPPLFFVLFRHYHKKIAGQYQFQGQQEGYIRHMLTNTLSGLPTIKSFTSEEYEKQRLTASGHALRTSTNDAFILSSYYAGLTKYAMVAGVILPMVYTGTLLMAGKVSMTTFMLQNFMTPKLINTMAGLDREYDLYQNAVAAARRLSAVHNIQPQILNGNHRLVKESVRGDLFFERISFNYPSSGQLFKEFELHISANSSTAIVGTTGSGKTTLIKLLLRFYDIKAGRILLDGTDISLIDVTDLRNAIGLVSQEVFLFYGTVYENILYGRPDASQQEVFEAARAAEALDFIQDLPDGFDTVIGELGQKLSGGQRQRISIARAVLKNPPILILDEATAFVDNETETALQRSLHNISKDRTLIIIAHRLSTVRHADCIYVIENGQISEYGTHNQLVSLDGTYASLWKLQTGEFIHPDQFPMDHQVDIWGEESKRRPE